MEQSAKKMKKYREQSAWLRTWGFCILLPLFFSLLLVLYILTGSVDIVSTDYIRLVNAYLPDTLNPAKLFMPDILTRIPLTYLFRALNVWLFRYSVNFDRLLGVLGLFLSAVVVLRYAQRMRIPAGFSLLLLVVLFSLNKWELLLNGSGYAHFLAFSLFYLHFLLLERWYQGTAGVRIRRGLLLLPWLVLLAAGPYLLVYAVCLLLCYSYCVISANRNVRRGDCLHFGLSALATLLLYLLSNHFAVYEYAGAQSFGLGTLIRDYPAFSLHFLWNGLASMLLSGELLEALLARGALTMRGIYAIGIGVSIAYAAAFFLYFREGLCRRTIFPALLLLYGLGSHFVVLLSRYVFLRESYAWQSRYSLQYQSGILGILLVFALYFSERRKKGAASPALRFRKAGILLLSVAFLLGNCYTSYAEMKKLPYRRARYEEMRAAAEQLQSYTDPELEELFEYHHGGERIRAAYRILEERKLNIFRE